MKVTKFTVWLKPLLVLSLICGFAFTATAQNHFPSTIGNTWGFLSTDGTERRTYTIEKAENVDNPDLILLKLAKQAVGTDSVTFDNSWVTVAEDGEILLHQVAFDRGAFGIAESTYDTPVTYFPATLPLGQKWEIVTETVLKIVGPTTTNSVLEVVAIEDVETPIGVFKNCAKVLINREAVTALQRLREEEILWLAPDVGPVKFRDTNEVFFDLESYNLVEPVVEDTQPTDETTDEVTDEVTDETTDEGTEAPTEDTTDEVTEDTTDETTDEVTEDTTDEVTEAPTEDTTEVEVPAEPMLPKAYEFNVTLDPGLNMVSIPLMPEVPYTAKSLAALLEATLVIRLDVPTQSFVAYTTLDEGSGFGIEGGKGYIVNIDTPTARVRTFTGTAWSDQPEAADNAPAAPTLATHKNTWAFVVTSSIRDMQTDTAYILVAENLRTGIIATQNVTSDVKRAAAVWADLNRKSVVAAGDKLEIALYDAHGTIVSGPFQRTVSTADIRNAFLNLQLSVGDVRPKSTVLAQNFPNPFNPETWIPYQLSKSAEVSIHIHNVAGQLIRTLDLGLKPTGTYMTPTTAAYWDGKNSLGERVSSGIYFYTLQTADFAATRRMVILK